MSSEDLNILKIKTPGPFFRIDKKNSNKYIINLL